MKFNMDAARAKFSQWLLVSIIHNNTKDDPDAEKRFDDMIKAPGWDSAKVDLKLLVNGVPFDIMDDTLIAIENHIDEEIETRSKASEFATEKMAALQTLLNIRNVEDLKDFMNGD